MGKTIQEETNDTAHDFFNDKKWLLWITGFAQERSGLYRVYLAMQLVFLIYMQVMAGYACYVSSPRKDLIVGALHVLLICTFVVWGLLTRIFTDRSLNITRNTLMSGIYQYEDEDPDPVLEKKRSGMRDEVRKKSGAFVLIFFVGALTNTVYVPISQLLFLDKYPEEDLANPYLAQFYYYPVSTRNPLGFIFIYITNLYLMLFVYGVASAMNEIYISITVQFRTHLEILNHSIRNIHNRAYQKLIKSGGGQQLVHLSQDELRRNKLFQKHLYSCLKSNAQHHQALLRLKKESHPFSGSCLLDTISLASIIYASTVYLMYQGPPAHIMVNYIITLFTEQTYAFYMCVFGEDIIQESGKLYESLYAVPWMFYDRSFNQILKIMMSNTLTPITIKAHFISFTTSLEVYADQISAMYKLLNLWRQSDQIN